MATNKRAEIGLIPVKWRDCGEYRHRIPPIYLHSGVIESMAAALHQIKPLSDTLALLAEGPVCKTESTKAKRTIQRDEFTATEAIKQRSTASIHIELPPKPHLQEYVQPPEQKSDMPIVRWIYQHYLDKGDFEWYPVALPEWIIELSTAKRGSHPDNIFQRCARARAQQEDIPVHAILWEWYEHPHFNTQTIKECLNSL